MNKGRLPDMLANLLAAVMGIDVCTVDFDETGRSDSPLRTL